jgi:two-component system nitrate/nitrite response regulator NarL
VTRVFVLADSEQSALDLTTLLSEDERLEVVGTMAATAAPESVIRAARPDVLLVSRVPADEIPDTSLPIVVLTDEFTEAWDGRNSVKARLPIHVTPPETFAALFAAAQGLTVLTPAQAELILSFSPAPQPAAPMPEALTPRETQVLRMMARGLANKEIAEQLGISDHTAKFHVASILSKLQAGSRTEAVTTGIRTGLIPI